MEIIIGLKLLSVSVSVIVDYEDVGTRNNSQVSQRYNKVLKTGIKKVGCERRALSLGSMVK